jgi:prophage regulatory protein
MQLLALETRGLMSATTEAQVKLLNLEALRERGIDYDRSHLWRLSKTGRFPKPVHVGPGRIAWVESEIDKWIKARVAARDGKAVA